MNAMPCDYGIPYSLPISMKAPISSLCGNLSCLAAISTRRNSSNQAIMSAQSFPFGWRTESVISRCGLEGRNRRESVNQTIQETPNTPKFLLNLSFSSRTSPLSLVPIRISRPYTICIGRHLRHSGPFRPLSRLPIIPDSALCLPLCSRPTSLSFRNLQWESRKQRIT